MPFASSPSIHLTQRFCECHSANPYICVKQMQTSLSLSLSLSGFVSMQDKMIDQVHFGSFASEEKGF
jgi:hypothetical protein